MLVQVVASDCKLIAHLLHLTSTVPTALYGESGPGLVRLLRSPVH